MVCPGAQAMHAQCLNQSITKKYPVLAAYISESSSVGYRSKAS